MRVSATRAALAVCLLGALVVWLIQPIGDACPDIGKLPAGSRSASAPSFAPPFTRTCTYATGGGIEARQRYIPIVDWIVLAVLAGVAGLGVTLLGGAGAPGATGRPAEVDGPPDWLAEPDRSRRRPRARLRRRPRTVPPPSAPSPDGESEAAARAAKRELERQQRARRRGR